MTDEDKVVVVPETDKPNPTPEEAKAPESVVVPPVKEIDPKYAGKSIEEVIEMHRNAESLASKKAAELAELKKAKPEPNAEELARFFAPEINQEDDPRDKEMAELKQAQLASKFKLDVMEAKDRNDMPDLVECLSEVIDLAKSKPGILVNNPNWVKDCYDLVQVPRIQARLQEAEERGKKIMTEKIVPKIEASIISEAAPVKAPEPAPVTTDDLKEKYRKGKISMEDYLRLTLTDAEKGIKK